MRFGFFDQLPCASGYSEPQRYKDIIAQIELGDAVGFDTAWLGEIHFIREFSILADPLMVLAAAAQRTSRIRLGTAVTLLPLHSPIKIAEEAAIADILSDGRLEFGVGRGIARHYASYGIPPEESRARFDEALDFILAAWTNDSFSFDGKYFQARELSLVPRPVQTPIPIVVGGGTPPAYRRAVTQGHGWYGFGLDVAEARKRVGALQEAARKSSRPKELGPLEISVTPPGYDVPDKAMIEAYAAAGVHRLILRPQPTMDAPALERFAAETGRALGLTN